MVEFSKIIQTITIVAPTLLLAVILHETAHGLVAEKLGDPTARIMGRITLNPVPHIDPVWTVLIPLVLIVSGSRF
ncbi:MAG: site-2 protease family protein, partial [Deltaproteobacteria bacterium]|nr:site-2 protease family protein [Deltaproteobacteria bacterium]